jgi:hypothetical protein
LMTVSARGVKQEPQGHWLQSFSLLLAIVVSFLLPLLPIFGFVNFAPVNLVASSIGVTLCALGMAVLVWARQHLGRKSFRRAWDVGGATSVSAQLRLTP